MTLDDSDDVHVKLTFDPRPTILCLGEVMIPVKSYVYYLCSIPSISNYSELIILTTF